MKSASPPAFSGGTHTMPSGTLLGISMEPGESFAAIPARTAKGRFSAFEANTFTVYVPRYHLKGIFLNSEDSPDGGKSFPSAGSSGSMRKVAWDASTIGAFTPASAADTSRTVTVKFWVEPA